jgi:hypothetical protein
MLSVASVVVLFIICPRDSHCRSSLFVRRLSGHDTADTWSCVSYSTLTVSIAALYGGSPRFRSKLAGITGNFFYLIQMHACVLP